MDGTYTHTWRGTVWTRETTWNEWCPTLQPCIAVSTARLHPVLRFLFSPPPLIPTPPSRGWAPQSDLFSNASKFKHSRDRSGRQHQNNPPRVKSRPQFLARAQGDAVCTARAVFELCQPYPVILRLPRASHAFDLDASMPHPSLSPLPSALLIPKPSRRPACSPRPPTQPNQHSLCIVPVDNFTIQTELPTLYPRPNHSRHCRLAGKRPANRQDTLRSVTRNRALRSHCGAASPYSFLIITTTTTTATTISDTKIPHHSHLVRPSED